MGISTVAQGGRVFEFLLSTNSDDEFKFPPILNLARVGRDLGVLSSTKNEEKMMNNSMDRVFLAEPPSMKPKRLITTKGAHFYSIPFAA